MHPAARPSTTFPTDTLNTQHWVFRIKEQFAHVSLDKALQVAPYNLAIYNFPSPIKLPLLTLAWLRKVILSAPNAEPEKPFDLKSCVLLGKEV